MRWAPRVSRALILRLYETDARGIVDEELIDEVAFGFYARCKSISTVTEAAFGKVECPSCGHVIAHHGGRSEVLRCGQCTWQITWGDYQKTYQHKQLVGGTALHAFEDFVARLPHAGSPSEKMRLIDAVIHECHKYVTADGQALPTRPAAVNLIEGTMAQVVALLEDLACGPASSPGIEENRIAWRAKVRAALTRWHPNV
ncbi:MAG: hypothetical protein HYY04_00295 [Chloroflexi bacterium]|nr:hypothetical protein [Chloroflexota bacterium]